MMEEIDILSEADERKRYWQDRNTQFEEDRRMLALELPIQQTGKVDLITNEPKIIYDTAVALVSSFAPRARLPLSINYSPEEKDKISKTERFASAIFRELDRRQLNRGQTYWIRELAYWIMSGWYAAFCVVKKTGSNVDFIADLWDPMTVYPEWDSDGLVKCIRSFETDKKTAQAMVQNWQMAGLAKDFRAPSHDSNITVVNYWRKDIEKHKPVVQNAIYVDGRVVKPLTKEIFDHIPIHIGAIGQPDMFLPDWRKRWGENIIAANKQMIEVTNTILTLMRTILAETAYPNLLSKTASGAPAVKSEDVKGYGQVIPLRLQDQLELLKHAATPREGFELLSYMLRQIAKGGFPDVVYGGLSVETSGFALSQLLAAIRYRIGPYWNTMQYVCSAVISDLLLQYKKSKASKVSLLTNNPESMKRGLIFVEEYTREDVPDNCFVDISIPITSTLDKTQQIIQARQALGAPQLLSRETLWDEFLDIQDSEQEYARILQDETLELPVVKQLMIIEQLRKRANALRVNGQVVEAKALDKYVAMLELQLGGQGQPKTTPAGGVPPEGMPPEMMESPDRNRAMAGIPPQGLERRGQTPQERAQSQQARVVSPSGGILVR